MFPPVKSLQETPHQAADGSTSAGRGSATATALQRELQFGGHIVPNRQRVNPNPKLRNQHSSAVAN
eukprot:1195691-Prorocentrum_minimum.AAC.2